MHLIGQVKMYSLLMNLISIGQDSNSMNFIPPSALYPQCLGRLREVIEAPFWPTQEVFPYPSEDGDNGASDLIEAALSNQQARGSPPSSQDAKTRCVQSPAEIPRRWVFNGGNRPETQEQQQYDLYVRK